MARIAVDLTPILPGGENGGAKIVAIELVRNMARIAPQHKFILLTLERNHKELESLDAENVRRVCVDFFSKASPIERIKQLGMYGTLFGLLGFIKGVIPKPLKNRLKVKFYKFISRVTLSIKSSGVLEQIKTDLLYCPFTAVCYYSRNVPVVSTVLDIQYKYYPDFFTVDDRYARNKNFELACKYADYLVCISNFVRQTVLDNCSLNPNKVKTIYLCLANRLPIITQAQNEELLHNIELKKNGYLLYPANFWKHKNHEMLFTAFGMYKKQNPESQLKLVCTGAPGERLLYLRRTITQMGLENQVIFLGYLSEDDFAALLLQCKAVIFPSLYEGFGIPVVEAMKHGKPVLCSNATSLPEIAGDAALYFNPRKPKEICTAIKTLENNQELVAKLIASGHKQVLKFCESSLMAREYLEIFNNAIQEKAEV